MVHADPTADKAYRALQKPIELCKGVVIANPALWSASLRQDIADGADGPRARHGAVQADLRRLARASYRGRHARDGETPLPPCTRGEGVV